MRRWLWHGLALICFAVLGYIAAGQVNTYLVMEHAVPGISPRHWQETWKETQQANAEWQAQVNELKRELRNPSLDTEIKAVRSFAGLEPLSGPGLKIVLRDREQPLWEGEDADCSRCK